MYKRQGSAARLQDHDRFLGRGFQDDAVRHDRRGRDIGGRAGDAGRQGQGLRSHRPASAGEAGAGLSFRLQGSLDCVFRRYGGGRSRGEAGPGRGCAGARGDVSAGGREISPQPDRAGTAGQIRGLHGAHARRPHAGRGRRPHRPGGGSQDARALASHSGARQHQRRHLARPGREAIQGRDHRRKGPDGPMMMFVL